MIRNFLLILTLLFSISGNIKAQNCQVYYQYTSGTCPVVNFYGASNTTVGTTTAWSWTFGDGTSSTIQNPIHTFSANGSYNVCVSITTSNGCVIEYCHAVEITCIPPPCEVFYQYTLGGCPIIYFVGTSNTISGTGVNWSWTFGDGTSSTVQNPIHTFSANGSYNVCVTITTANGCMDEYCHAVEITCIPPPCEAYFQYTSGDCPTINFSGVTNATIGTTTTWSWTFGDGTTSTVQNPVHTYAANGSYNVCLTITKSNGCVDEYCHEVGITCIPPPCEVFYQYTLGACPIINFFGTSNTISGTGITWSWNFGDGTTSTVQNPVHTYIANGSYSVCVFITTANGCVDEYCHIVEITCIPPPCEVFYQYTLGACPVIYFVGTSNTISGTVVNWSWTFGDGTSSTVQNPIHTYSANGSYNVCVTITTANGCMDEYCHAVVISCIPPPCEAYFQYTLGLCPEILFFGVSTSGTGTVTDWNWTFGDGSTSSVQNPVHTYTANGSYEVCLTITKSNGCVDEYCHEVGITCIPPPCEVFYQYTLGGCPIIYFVGTATTISGTSVNWSWTFGDGTSSTVQNPIHTFSANGSYNVCVTITTANGCMDEYCHAVEITCIPPPCEAYFQYTLGLCPEILFFGVSTSGTGTVTDWHWTFGDGSTSSVQNPVHTYTANGSYNVCLTITKSNGCVDEYCHEVEITCIPPPCEVFYQYTLGACPIIYFVGTSNTISGTGVNWSWTFGDGTSSTVQNPIHTFSANGSYNVCVTITTANGCMDEYCHAVEITCIPPPCEAYFQYTSGDCPTINFSGVTNATIGTTTTWSWTFGDGTTSTVQNPVHTYAANGSYNVCLTITKSNGCVDEYCHAVEITCIPPPCEAYFQYTLGLCPEILFFGVSTSGTGTATDWHWSFGDGSTSSVQNPVHTYTANGSYEVCLTITKSNGCVDEYCHIVEITCIPPPCEVFYEYTSNSCPDIGFFGVANKTAGSSIEWHWNFGDGASSNLQNPSHSYEANGSYVVCLTISTSSGCTAEYCDTIDITCIITGLIENINNLISIYPNPVHDVIHVKFNSGIDVEEVFIYDIKGQEIFKQKSFHNSSMDINMKSFESGIYLLSIKTAHSSAVFKVIKL